MRSADRQRARGMAGVPREPTDLGHPSVGFWPAAAPGCSPLGKSEHTSPKAAAPPMRRPWELRSARRPAASLSYEAKATNARIHAGMSAGERDETNLAFSSTTTSLSS